MARRRICLLLLAPVFAACLAAQPVPVPQEPKPAPAVQEKEKAKEPGKPTEQPKPQDKPKPTADEVQKAIETWLTSPQSDLSLLEATVKTVIAGDNGIAQVGAILGAATDPAEKRTKGIQDIATQTALAFVKREAASGTTYAGQYDPLAPLMPFVGRLFTVLLFATPQWYPHTHRGELVPALRDLLPTAPGEDVIAGAIEIVDNTEIEPETLRVALACALHQWGHKQHIQPQLTKLQQESMEGTPDNRADAVRRLAELHYQLRDFRASASHYESLLKLAEKSGARLGPTDWYGAACSHALAGATERALQCLEACAALQAGGNVDPSLKMEKRAWEQDRDLTSLRGNERYKKAFAKAFGGEDATGKAK